MVTAGYDVPLDPTNSKARTEKIRQPSQDDTNSDPHPFQQRPLADEQKPRKGCVLSATKSGASEYQHAALPSVELVFYVGVIAVLFFYFPYQVHQVSKENAASLHAYLRPGWSLFGQRLKDESNDQWLAFFDMITLPVVLSIVAYVVLGQVVTAVAPKFKKHFMLLYSMAWIYTGLGGSALLVLLVHSVLLYLACLLGSQILVWIVVLLAIASVNVDAVVQIQEKYLGDTYFAYVSIATSTLRLLCFGLESCRNSNSKSPSLMGYGLLDLLLYNFYLPVFPYGPIIRYDTFLIQMNVEVKLFSLAELKHIMKELTHCLVWTMITELHIHFLYFGAMTQHQPTWRTLDPPVLGLLVLYHLFFFQLSTFVPYYYARVLALFDRVEAPQPPICILSMHFFRDMWKYFDRGLNAMLLRYIYIPLGGSRHGLLRQSLAALGCFVFVGCWHGGGESFLTWALLNWLGVQVEVAALAFSHGFGPLHKLQQSMSAPMLRRFYSLCAVPNYLFLASSNVVFVLGPSKTWYIVKSIIWHDWPWYTLKVTGVVYCCVQVVNELERRVGKRKLLDKKYH